MRLHTRKSPYRSSWSLLRLSRISCWKTQEPWTAKQHWHIGTQYWTLEINGWRRDRRVIFGNWVLLIYLEQSWKQGNQEERVVTSRTSNLTSDPAPELYWPSGDGVHLTTAGYDVLCEMINTMIHTGFRRRGINWDDQEDCPWTVPEWVISSLECLVINSSQCQLGASRRTWNTAYCRTSHQEAISHSN